MKRKGVVIHSGVTGDLFFNNNHARLGRFVSSWVWCVGRNDPTYYAHPEDMDEHTSKLAISCKWVVESRGKLFLTGPDKNKLWLRQRGPQIATYVIEAVGQGLVKIGKSRNPLARMSQLQTSNAHELKMVAVVSGDHESALHQLHAAHRVGGEWFRFVPEIQESMTAISVREGGDR
jgi:hypothetical protein